MPSLDTTVLLIHHGVTDWHQQNRLLGRTDRPLDHAGRAQAEEVAARLEVATMADLISSPLRRAVETAECIGRRHELDVARDSRLTAIDAGTWTGAALADLADDPEYRQFIANPATTRIPGGESLEEARRRAVAATEQAIEDSPSGDAIALVTHGRVIRVLLCHYLGAPPAAYQRLQVNPGSISILSFHRDNTPRVVAINWFADLGQLFPPGRHS